MTEEIYIQQELVRKFSFPQEAVRLVRHRRLWMDVAYADFPKVLEFCRKNLKFTMLPAITGLDEGERLGLIYHVAREDGIVLNIKTGVPKAVAVVKTVTASFASATIYERELTDLLGITVEGLPRGARYPLPDDWPLDQFPLRKDWKPPVAPKKE